DGAAMTVSLTEGGWTRQIAATGTPVQTTYFTFLNTRQGTVSDTRDGRAVGVFRLTPAGLMVDFADERSELWTVTSEGVAWTESAPARTSICTAWYPQGHTFSVAERQAAVAAYAARIGIAYAPTVPVATCNAATAQASGMLAPTVVPASASQPAIPRRVGAKQAALNGSPF